MFSVFSIQRLSKFSCCASASVCPKQQFFLGLALLFLFYQCIHEDPLTEDGSSVLLFLSMWRMHSSSVLSTLSHHGFSWYQEKQARRPLEGEKKKDGCKQSFDHNTNLLLSHYGEGTPRKLFAKPCHFVPQLGCLLVAFIIGSLLQLHLCSSQWCTVTLTICGTFHSTCAWDCAWLQSSTLCI